ncbi:MAG: Pectinesterase [Segetibacter sp.]|nr:Pectinesterase [Segetibacter sp.]
MHKILLKKTGLVALFLLLSVFFSTAYAYDVVVAKDGSGNYTTVGAAIRAAPTGRTTAYTIFIKNGKYREKDTVPSNKPFIQLVGESVANVIISWDDFSGKPIPGGGGATFGTGNSATFTVSAADFSAINVTFENTTGEAPQALAINVTGDRSAFKNCRFLGGQDTIFAGGNGARQHFKNCYIDGTVDFIFGDARAVFDSCVIYAKTRSSAGQSFITAANTKQTEPYGYVFRDCIIPANRGNTVYVLGRPWQNDASTTDAAKSYNKTIFINTTMSSSISTAGWSAWDLGTDVTKITYAEYRSKKFDSTLVDVSGRASWSKQLTATEAANYNNSNLFGTWDPCTVSVDFCASEPRPIAVSNYRGVKGTSTSLFTWNISWPIAGVKYEVLRSSDRTTFTKVSEQTSLNDSAVNFSYSEAIPPPGQTYFYLIQASKAGYNTHITDTVTISSTPTITVSGSLGSFIQGVGTPSTSQSYVVSAASLTNNLIITAPTYYELSTNGTSWSASSNPIVFTQDVNGNVANTTIFVRLNATLAGTYNGNIVHASTGADTVRLAVTGTVQSTPLTVSTILEWWPLSANSMDSAAVRAQGVVPTTPTFNNLYLANGTTVPAIPAYSPTYGQAFGASANGDGTWTTAIGGPGSNVNRAHYEQFTITASSTHSLRVDSLILSTSIHNSANGRFAAVYSRSGFTTDSTDIQGAAFATPVTLANETGGTTVTYRLAFSGGAGLTLTAGQTLTFRLYYAVGSSSAGRYAKLKNVQLKGLATANPIVSDYRTRQSGEWSDVNTWERYDGSAWVYPAPSFPLYNSSNSVTILNGHTVSVTASSSLPSGSYTDVTRINKGGQLIVNSGMALNIANDANAITTDLQVDGTLTVLGSVGSNGTNTILVTGNVVTTGSFSVQGTDVLTISPAGTYQHNANSPNVPAALWQPGSTLIVTGLTTSQTGIFKNNITYSNIVWNNQNEANYYAYRLTLDSINVKGSFTVQSTGSTYISFANTSGRIAFPGGFYQTGGTVNFRESGTITDTLDLGGDFSVTGGTFNSNMGTGSSLLIRLDGVNKTIVYSQSSALNTNWQVNGSYSLVSNLVLPSGGFGVTVNGTLNMGTFATTGSGIFTANAASIIISGSPTGLNGNIANTGTKTLSAAASFIFNGAVTQTTGTLLPATVNALTITNADDVTLNGGNVTVTNGLSLLAGKLIVGDNTITTSSVWNSSSAKYVVTNGVGFLKINNIGTGNNVFPVGPSTTSYNPVTLNNAGATDNFSVNVKTTFNNAVPDPNKVVNRQWTINEDVAGGSNATVSLAWTTADQSAGFNPTSSTSIIRFNGTAWLSYPATITGAGTTTSPYVATASGVTSFSPFTVMNDAALPLNLISFNASYLNNQVNVTWSTSNEVSTKEFQVERSVDGLAFSTTGTIRAKNTTGVNNYEVKDHSPLSGITYYRLKSFDIDGKFTYSKTVAVAILTKVRLSIFANPVASVLMVTHAPAKQGAAFYILSFDGKELLKANGTVATSQTKIEVGGLTTGLYLLIFYNGNEKSAINFIKY